MNFFLYMSINQRTYKMFSRLSNQQVSLSLPMSRGPLLNKCKILCEPDLRKTRLKTSVVKTWMDWGHKI